MFLVITEGMITGLISLATLVIGFVSKYWVDKYQKSKSKHDAHKFLEENNEELFIKIANLRKDFLKNSGAKDLIIEELQNKYNDLKIKYNDLQIDNNNHRDKILDLEKEVGKLLEQIKILESGKQN